MKHIPPHLASAGRVRIARITAGWSREMLASALGVSDSTLGSYLSGARALESARGRVSLGAIAKVLDVTPDSLVRGGPCPCCGRDTRTDSTSGPLRGDA